MLSTIIAWLCAVVISQGKIDTYFLDALGVSYDQFPPVQDFGSDFHN